MSSTASKAVDAGFRFVHASSNYFYLDCGGGAWMGGVPNGNSWCDPFKTWQKVSGRSSDQSRVTSGRAYQGL